MCGTLPTPGVAMVTGCALWGGETGNSVGGHYTATIPTTIGAFGALLAILAGIFGILDLNGVKPK